MCGSRGAGKVCPLELDTSELESTYLLCKVAQFTPLLQSLKEKNTCHSIILPYLSYSSQNPGIHYLCFLPPLPPHSSENPVLDTSNSISNFHHLFISATASPDPLAIISPGLQKPVHFCSFALGPLPLTLPGARADLVQTDWIESLPYFSFYSFLRIYNKTHEIQNSPWR